MTCILPIGLRAEGKGLLQTGRAILTSRVGSTVDVWPAAIAWVWQPIFPAGLDCCPRILSQYSRQVEEGPKPPTFHPWGTNAILTAYGVSVLGNMRLDQLIFMYMYAWHVIAGGWVRRHERSGHTSGLAED